MGMGTTETESSKQIFRRSIFPSSLYFKGSDVILDDATLGLVSLFSTVEEAATFCEGRGGITPPSPIARRMLIFLAIAGLGALSTAPGPLNIPRLFSRRDLTSSLLLPADLRCDVAVEPAEREENDGLVPADATVLVLIVIYNLLFRVRVLYSIWRLCLLDTEISVVEIGSIRIYVDIEYLALSSCHGKHNIRIFYSILFMIQQFKIGATYKCAYVCKYSSVTPDGPNY